MNVVPGVFSCSHLPQDVSLSAALVFQAADRPDRLQVDVLDGPANSDATSCLGELRPGCAVQFRHGEAVSFSGIVERSALCWDRRGRIGSVVAHAPYEEGRARKPVERYYRLTDSEIAVRIATDLGLEPRVESTGEILDVVERRDDPLRFLRRRAREIGFQLAVSGGVLFFSGEPPPSPRPVRVLEVDAPLLSIEIEDHGSRGRGGAFEVAADPDWQPLREFDVRGFGSAWDGRYRVMRCRHISTPSRHSTAVTFLEQGTDIEIWRAPRRAS